MATTILTYNKMQSIKACSKNNKKELETFIEEVEFAKIRTLLGDDIYNAILADSNASPVDPEVQEILDGGLYKCIAYYVYARYIQESMLVDTFTGMVRKDRTDSSTAPVGQLKNVANEYTEMAMMAFKLVECKIQAKYGHPKEETRSNFSEIIGVRRDYCRKKGPEFKINYFK